MTLRRTLFIPNSVVTFASAAALMISVGSAALAHGGGHNSGSGHSGSNSSSHNGSSSSKKPGIKNTIHPIIVRDPKGASRDHRKTTDTAARDHRKKDAPTDTSVVRDHRNDTNASSAPPAAAAPIVRDHRDSNTASSAPPAGAPSGSNSGSTSGSAPGSTPGGGRVSKPPTKQN